MAPTIFIVPGFYEGPTVFKPLADALTTRGLTVYNTVISSTGSTPPNSPNMDDDIARVAKDLAPVVEQAGEEGVVVVLHSAAGFIGSGALKGLTHKARHAANKPGGVTKIIFLTAAVAPEGYEQGPMPFFDYHESNGTQTCKNPRDLLFGDFSDEEAQKWLSAVQHQPVTDWSTKLQFCGWRDVSSVYMVCEEDKILPVSLQEQFAAVAGSKIVRISCGHMLQLSHTEEVADIIVSCAS